MQYILTLLGFAFFLSLCRLKKIYLSPMMKKAPTNTMIKKIRTNVIILLTALVFAVAVFYVKNNPDIFLASILSLQQQQYITEK